MIAIHLIYYATLIVNHLRYVAAIIIHHSYVTAIVFRPKYAITIVICVRYVTIIIISHRCLTYSVVVIQLRYVPKIATCLRKIVIYYRLTPASTLDHIWAQNIIFLRKRADILFTSCICGFGRSSILVLYHFYLSLQLKNRTENIQITLERGERSNRRLSIYYI